MTLRFCCAEGFVLAEQTFHFGREVHIAISGFRFRSLHDDLVAGRFDGIAADMDAAFGVVDILPFEGAALSAAHPRGNNKLEVRFVQDTYTFQRLNQLFHRFIVRDFLFLLLPSVFLGVPRGIVIEIGRNKKQMQEYIKNQLTENQIADQIGMKEFVDPFTGSVNQKA